MILKSMSRDLYNRYKIPKMKDGQLTGWRIIEEPVPELKKVQRELIQTFSTFPIHSAAHGVTGTSNTTNAEVHVDSTIIIKLDIKDFFTNTTMRMVEDAIIGMGFNYKERQEYSKMLKYCFVYKSQSIEDLYKETRLNYYNGHVTRLPQGAPTSPILANIAFYPFDVKLKMLADEYCLKYTRYVDDITFSGDFRPQRFIQKVMSRVWPYQINKKKIESLHKAYQSQEITGVVVNQKSSVPRKRRKLLKAKLDHLAREGKDLTEEIRGELSYVQSVNKDQYQALVEHYDKRKRFYKEQAK